MSESAAQKLKDELEQQLSDSASARDSYVSELEDAAAEGDAALESTVQQEPAMAVLCDKTLPAKTRVEVLDRLAGAISRRDDYIEAMLEIVQDADDDDDVRSAALNLLGTAAFQVARFRPHEQAYLQALRDLVSDEDANLREAAVDTLAVQHDPEVQQTLLAGLQGDGPLPVPRERAIQLLAEDDHLDNLPWLRELYAGGSDDERQEAVRLMSAYPAARETLEGVLRDRDEATQVRQQSAASLHNLAPEHFENLAKEIATDSSDYAEIRMVSLSTLQHLGDSDSVYGDADFLSALQDVGADESAPPVAERARSIIEGSPEQ